MIASLPDTLLDRTVVPGYTTVGYRLRRRMWDAGDLRPMNGETVLVTGATERTLWTREPPADRERLWRECERLTGWHAAAIPPLPHAHP